MSIHEFCASLLLLVFSDDTLIYVGKGRMQIVCRSDYDKKKAVQWCHNNRLTNEPCNVKDTIKMLQKSYYWHGLNKDIEKRVCCNFFFWTKSDNSSVSASCFAN